MTQILRSSRQASNIFALDGVHPPRPKNLFYVSFTRGTDTSLAPYTTLANNSFIGDLGFLVKSTERPQVQPVVEEVNQYNKKRLIQTGVRYSPLRITFYDTIDNLFMQMFADYASNYFGGFGHDDYRDDYLNDVLTTYADSAQTGWGFAPSSANQNNTDINSHIYFRKISIFEVWGDKYVQTDIINPRITAFDPEAMSYEDSNIGTISMTLNYEAVVYVNGGASLSLSGASNPNDASTAFVTELAGQTIDYPYQSSAYSENNYTDYKFAAGATASQSPYLLSNTYAIPEDDASETPYLLDLPDLTDGPLATYGDYDFGSGYQDFLSSNYSSAQNDLLGGVVTNSTVAATLNTTTTLYSETQTSSGSGIQGVTTAIPAQTIASDQADVILASVQALGATYPVGPNTSFYEQKIAASAVAAAKAQGGLPRAQVFTTSPKLANAANNWDSSTPAGSGIALSTDTYTEINQSRPASAQIGYNTRTLRSQSG